MFNHLNNIPKFKEKVSDINQFKLLSLCQLYTTIKSTDVLKNISNNQYEIKLYEYYKDMNIDEYLKHL